MPGPLHLIPSKTWLAEVPKQHFLSPGTLRIRLEKLASFIDDNDKNPFRELVRNTSVHRDSLCGNWMCHESQGGIHKAGIDLELGVADHPEDFGLHVEL